MRKVPFFYGWMIVAVAFLSLAIAYSVRYSFTVMSVVIEEEFGWSRRNIHFAYTLMITTYGFSGPLMGYLLDKYGPRRLMPVGGLLLGAGLIGCGFLTELWHLYLFYSLSAVGVSCLGMVCFGTLVSKWFESRRGTAWGLAASGTGFGMFVIVGFFVPWLIEKWNFRVGYIVLGFLSVAVVVPLTARFTQRSPEELGLLPDGRSSSEADTARSQLNTTKARLSVIDQAWVSTDWTLPRAMRTMPFWMMTGCIFFFTLSLYSVMMHQVQHAVDVGFDITTASHAFGVVGLFGMAGKFLWGHCRIALVARLRIHAGCFAFSSALHCL